MKFRKVFVVLGALVVLAQVSNPDTIYFRDGTVIENCKVLEFLGDSVKVKVIEEERPSQLIPGATEKVTKEVWFSKDEIGKIKYESGAVKYIRTTPPKAGPVHYALEFIGATAGAVYGPYACYYASAYVLCPLMGYYAWPFFLLSMAVATPVGSACGVAIIGELFEPKGSFGGALVGSVIGEILLYYALETDNAWLWVSLPMPFISFSIPIARPLSAAIGYNYKTLSKGNLPAIGKILVGSAAVCGACLLLSSFLQ